MEALQELLSYLIAAIPNILGALAIFAVGYIFARVTYTIMSRLLAAAGIDRLTDRLLKVDIIAKSNLQVRVSAVIAKTVYYFIMLIVLVAATDVLGMEIVSNLVSSAIVYLPNLIAAVIIFIIGIILADALRDVAVVTSKSIGIPASGMIGSLIFWFVFISILITALSQAQLETEFLVANISIIVGGLVLAFAIAYGLAARPLMSGFLAQFYNQGKINVGDRIEISEYSGKVVSIDRTTLILSDGGEHILIPLSDLQTETIRVVERSNADDARIETIKVDS